MITFYFLGVWLIISISCCIIERKVDPDSFFDSICDDIYD